MTQSTAAPAVQALADLAALQPDTVVSRVLLKTAGGSVTVFAFAEGEGLTEHTSPREALVAVTDGEAEITVEGETHTVRAGETIRLPADVPHAVHAATDFRMLLVLLRA